MQRKLFTKLFQKSNILFGVVVLLTLLVRGIYLDRFPTGVNHDEAEVLLSAISYVNSGTDLTGSPFPYSLYSTDTEAGLSGLPSFLMSFVFMLIPLNELTARFVYFALSFATSLALFKLVRVMGGSLNLARISMLFFLVSPWMVFYSRALTEAPFALFFLVLSLIYYFEKSRKSSGVFYFIFTIFAYFSYQGAKPLVIILSTILAAISLRFPLYKGKLYYALSSLVFSVVFILISMVDKNSTISKRSSEVPFLNPSSFSSQVDDARLRSINTPLTGLFENKYVYLVQNSFEVYLGFFDPDVLFWGGDPAATYRLGNWGLLYVFDLLFIFIAIYAAGGKNYQHKNLFYLAVFLLGLGIAGSIFSGVRTSYIFRSFLAPIGVVILVSLGAYFLIGIKSRFKNLLVLSTVCVYSIFFLFFMHRFLTSYPVMQQENQFYSEKVLSEFLNRIPPETKVVVGGVSPTQLSNMYLFYKGKVNFDTANKVQEGITVGNIKFTSSCDIFDGDINVSRVSVCGKSANKTLIIQDFKDAGYIFEVDGINYCSDYVKSDSYRQSHRFSDYKIETMNNENFCKRNLFIKL